MFWRAVAFCCIVFLTICLFVVLGVVVFRLINHWRAKCLIVKWLQG